MNTEEFRKYGKAMVDYIADYWDTLKERENTLPSVQPGFIEEMIPSEAPEEGEEWNDIVKDLNKIIIPGLTHWNSPNFHAYFPCGNSFPSVLGEMLSAGLGGVGLNWMASPICTELEIMMLNWMGKAFNLPPVFLDSNKGYGGGVIQGSSTESILIAVLAAKEKKVQFSVKNTNNANIFEIKEKLVAYTSDQANSCVEKVGTLASITMKHLKSENGRLRGKTLKQAIREDKERGLIPCAVIATCGTTGTCAFDEIEELGKICTEEGLWLHIDAAYAGTTLICPEFRYFMRGFEFADSLNISPHKLMLINIDCTAFWLKDARYLFEVLSVDKIYLKHKYEGLGRDYHKWQINLGRKFKALKIWFVLRSYGIKGIQKYVRNHINLAQYFERLVETDPRFEVYSSSLGLVCFRLKGNNNSTKSLLDTMISDKKYYFIPYEIENKLVIRFTVCSRLANRRDVEGTWNTICSAADTIVTENGY